MKHLRIVASLALVTGLIFHLPFATAQTLPEVESARVNLPNGWSLTPVGDQVRLGDLPLNIAVSPSQEMAAVTNNGQSVQTIQLIDLANRDILDSVIIKKSWLGLAFTSDGRYLWASGGNDNMVIRYALRNGHLVNDDTIRLGKPWPEKISVAGLAVDKNRERLYAVTRENNSLYVLDTGEKKIESVHPL
ncbi:MAG TPA: hypothetical protein VE870_08585, partial [Bacteroidales bacterium]|nr:hypothetical protein [Bacteroidales bacterium]